MSLNKRQKQELSDDMKKLLASEYIDDDLLLTRKGKTQLLNLLLDEYKQEMVETAERILHEHDHELMK